MQMSTSLRRLLAFGPRLAALLVLLAALVAAPLTLPAAPEPCCCPSVRTCKCPEHQRGYQGQTSLRRCSSPTSPVAPAPAPVADLPSSVVQVTPAIPAPPIAIALPVPHPSPDRDRPRGPS